MEGWTALRVHSVFRILFHNKSLMELIHSNPPYSNIPSGLFINRTSPYSYYDTLTTKPGIFNNLPLTHAQFTSILQCQSCHEVQHNNLVRTQWFYQDTSKLLDYSHIVQTDPPIFHTFKNVMKLGFDMLTIVMKDMIPDQGNCHEGQASPIMMSSFSDSDIVFLLPPFFLYSKPAHS